MAPSRVSTVDSYEHSTIEDMRKLFANLIRRGFAIMDWRSKAISYGEDLMGKEARIVDYLSKN